MQLWSYLLITHIDNLANCHPIYSTLMLVKSKWKLFEHRVLYLRFDCSSSPTLFWYTSFLGYVRSRAQSFLHRQNMVFYQMNATQYAYQQGHHHLKMGINYMSDYLLSAYFKQETEMIYIYFLILFLCDIHCHTIRFM